MQNIPKSAETFRAETRTGGGWAAAGPWEDAAAAVRTGLRRLEGDPAAVVRVAGPDGAAPVAGLSNAWTLLSAGRAGEAAALYAARFERGGAIHGRALYRNLEAIGPGGVAVGALYALLPGVPWNAVLHPAPAVDGRTPEGLRDNLAFLHLAAEIGPEDPAVLHDIACGILRVEPPTPERIRIALTLLHHAWETAPHWPAPLGRMANLLLALRELDRLFQVCRLLERLPGCHPVFRLVRALLTLEMGEPAQARRLLRGLLDEHPGHADAHGALALAAAVEIAALPFTDRGTGGRALIGPAEQAARAALALDGGNPTAHLALAMLYGLFGRWAESAAHAGRVLAACPAMSYALFLVARSHQARNRLAEADAAFTGLHRRGGNDAALRHRSHLRRWSGALDGSVVFTPIPDGPWTEEGGDPALVADTRILRLCPLADHGFALTLAVEDLRPAGAGEETVLLEGLRAYALRLSVDAGGTLALSVGDGSRWSLLERAPLARLDGATSIRLTLTRRAGGFTAVVDGGGRRDFPCSDAFAIPGDTLVVGPGDRPLDPLPFRVAGFRLGIAPYEPGLPSRRVHVVSFFFGEAYARMFAGTMLASLFLAENLPDLRRDHAVTVRVYCTDAEAPLIAPALDLLRRQGFAVELDLDVIGCRAGDPRANLGDCVADAIAAALREDAVIVMAQPDHVFGRGLAGRIRALPRHGYLVCGHPRVDTAGLAAVERLVGDPARHRALTNADLVRLAVEGFPHNTLRAGLAGDEYWLRARREADRVVVNFKEPPPLAFYPARDLLAMLTGDGYTIPFEAIDHDIVDLMHRTGRLHAVTDSRDFFWLEFSPDRKNAPTIFNDYWSRGAQAMRALDLHWHTGKAGESGGGPPS
ncbi:hypothetical protein [Azospirillum oleiclasticum]|uniref:hypothetical protein n=1 Tax=Azospirillum oleiclasticum TaxID=2735135 RepID=UPI0015D4F943|nr:hypothetical protein [Azospirillum oleiclasticum]